MVVKGDQQRIRALIKDTLTLLCKNGLSFDSQFCMEALIVFTLDNDDVFHVSINETVKNQLAVTELPTFSTEPLESEQRLGVTDGYNSNVPNSDKTEGRRSPAGSKRRRSSLVTPKEEPDFESNGDSPQGLPPTEGPDLVDTHGAPPATYEDSSSQSILSSDEPPNKRHQGRPTSHASADDGDVIVIKEELDESSWQSPGDGGGDAPAGYSRDSSYGDLGAVQPPYGDVDLAQALGSGLSHSAGQNIWGHASQAQATNRSATITSGTGELAQQRVSPAVEVYQCLQCSKKFSTCAGLKEHMKLHLGIYKYYCDICRKGFSSSSARRGHMAKHTGVKEFVCPLCGKAYCYQHDLKSHMKKHFSP